MADIAKVKRNIQKMIDQGAPETDIDAYVASEGTSPEELQATSAATPQPQEFGLTSGSVSPDYPNQFAAGVAKGVIGLAEMPGAIRDLTQQGTKWAAGKMGMSPEGVQNLDAGFAAQKAFGPFGGAPSPGTIRPMVEKVTGPFREPQSGMEGLVDRAGQFAPGVLMGPGAMGPKAGAWIGSTLGSEGGKRLGDAFAPKASPYLEFGGALLGGAAGLKAVESATKSAATKAAINAVPKTEQLEATATQLFKQADDIGLAVKPEGYSDMIDDVFRAAGDDGFFPANHSKLANAFSELEKWRGSPITLDKLQQLRRNIKSAYDPANPQQNEVMRTALNKFDEVMENLRPDQVLNGNTKAATILLKEANPMWAKFRKAELFDNVTQNAKNAVGANYTEAGFQTAIRQQLRGIAKDNFKRFKYLKPAEREQILQVINGGKVENFLRRWGGFSLLSQTGGIKSSGAGYLASLIGGPAAGATVGGVLAGGGTIARPISTAMSKNNFNLLKATVRNGQPLVIPNARGLLGSQVPIQGLLGLNATQQVRGPNN